MTFYTIKNWIKAKFEYYLCCCGCCSMEGAG